MFPFFLPVFHTISPGFCSTDFFITHILLWPLFSYQDRSEQSIPGLSRGYNAKQSPQGKVLMGEFLLLPELIEKKNAFRQAEKIKCSRLVQGWSSSKWLRQLKQNRIEAAGNETMDSKGTEADEIWRHYFPRQNQEGFLLESLIKATVTILKELLKIHFFIFST